MSLFVDMNDEMELFNGLSTTLAAFTASFTRMHFFLVFLLMLSPLPAFTYFLVFLHLYLCLVATMTDLHISYGANGTPARNSNLPKYVNSQAISIAPEYKPGDDPVRGEEEVYGPKLKRFRITSTKTRIPAPTTLDNCERGPVPRVVDQETIERHKENTAPLKSNRVAAALIDLFFTPKKKRAAALKKQRARFEKEISNADKLDDPLEVYQRYVEWTLHSCLESDSYAGMLPVLLERCTRKFRNCSRYTNDPRYVRISLLHAELVSDPLAVYKFLETNNIGQKQVPAYQEYAEYLEKKKMWREAELCYKLGINRFAQQLTRIEEEFFHFQLRMLSAKVTPSESKSVKGVSHMFEKNAITKTPLVEQQPAVRHISKGVLSKQTTSLNQRPASAVHHEPANAKNENGKRRLQAYVDQENIPPSGSIATTTTAAAVDGETQASWNVLGTKAGRIKKNEAAVDSWRKPLKLRPVAPKELIKSKVYKYEQGTLDEAPKTPSHDAPTRSKEYDLSSRSTSLKMCPDAPEKLIKLKAYKYKVSNV
ncbi:Mad3/BUB1 homology region 1-domain-containing protein [Syncephalis plumigaleata]|nr:Mad3/BUB1 homology region 1-domain-containing protein [Syncephalis plumigaleata]